MRSSKLCLVFCLLAAACAGDDDTGDGGGGSGSAGGGGGIQPDAGVGTPDGPPPAGTSAVVIDCASADEGGDVWYYSGIGFMGPNAPIAVGKAIRFHDLEGHTADHVGGAWSASGQNPICVRFGAPGSYQFGCYFHAQESGAIVVQ